MASTRTMRCGAGRRATALTQILAETRLPEDAGGASQVVAGVAIEEDRQEAAPPPGETPAITGSRPCRTELIDISHAAGRHGAVRLLRRGAARSGSVPRPRFVGPSAKVGRSDPCPCGSGRKFKQCHGR
jgi:hypothetical protein